MSNLSVSNTSNFSTLDNPDKKTEPKNQTIETIKTNIYSSDNVVSKKIKEFSENGANPFGNPFNKTNPDSEPKGTIAKHYSRLAKSIDMNNDGFLSRRELVEKLDDKNVKGQDAAFVGSLIQEQSKIQRLSNDEKYLEIKGITQNDIAALDNSDSKLKDEVTSTYSYSVGKIYSSKSNFDTKGNLKIPTKASDVNFKDLAQGSAGDCYFLAALASLAQRNPQKIVDMIHDNKNGTYDVKFSDRTVTINAPTDTELGLYAEGKAWVPIIEKGYAQYRNGKDVIAKTNYWDNSGKGTIVTGRSIKELTGNNFDTDPLIMLTKDMVREKLKTAVNNNKLMVASINNNPFGENKFKLPDGHVYSVLDFDAKTDKVTIRNPWGQTEAQDSKGMPLDGKDDGIFELSLEDFAKTFSTIAYEK